MKSYVKKEFPRKPYVVGDKQIDQLITQLAARYGLSESKDLLREILTTAVKLGKEGVDKGDLKLLNTSLKELRHAFRIFAPFREARKIIVFGSSRAKQGSAPYRMAEAFSKEMAKRDFFVITGAGLGIMEAANKGAGLKHSFGVNIRLPFEQQPNKYIKKSPSLINFKYFFTRKLIFIKESDATALFPGGFGTHDEGFENLTLFQTGKSRPRPIVLMEPKGSDYWRGWRNFVKRHLLKRGYISEDDMKLFTIVSSTQEAADYIEDFYKVYHSIRYVKDLTILRLQHPLSDELIKRLKREFKDILVGGYIKNSGPVKEEIQRNSYPYLPRLILRFNKQRYGRLCELIHAINND
jgi:uncharacterized protein (TIGR00730 family)